jgi:hypothetical protein
MPSWPCAVSVRPNITPLRLSKCRGPINADEVFGTHTNIDPNDDDSALRRESASDGIFGNDRCERD